MAGKSRVLWAGEGEKARYYANEGKGKRRGRRASSSSGSNSPSGEGRGSFVPKKYMTKAQKKHYGWA